MVTKLVAMKSVCVTYTSATYSSLSWFEWFRLNLAVGSPLSKTTEGNKGKHRQTRYRLNSGCIARDSACLSGITVVYIRSYVFQQIASVDLWIGERVCDHGNGRAKRRWKTCAHVIFPRQPAAFDVKTIFFLAHTAQSHSLFYLE